jgi:type IV secretory pathway protease TraF
MVKLQPPPLKTRAYVETLVEPGHWIVTFMMNGTQVVLLQKVVSKDGETVTVTTSSVGMDGKPSEQIVVYDKQ